MFVISRKYHEYSSLKKAMDVGMFTATFS